MNRCLCAAFMTACILLLPCHVQAINNQASKTITGTVVAATDGLPLIGASVLIKGTTTGVTTDLDGNFTLQSVPANASLIISYIGYKSQEITVGNNSRFTIKLNDDSEQLEEVVVVGYGVQKKKLVTGATLQIGGDNIQKLSTTSPLTALQSQSPGVFITQSSGQPGSGFKVNIRGLGTIGTSAPLYVIDGVAGGDINSLNPGDIESVDVLKDAASSAIYGARAANGVILVTTKQGKATSGKISVSYDGYYGVQNVARMPQLLTAKQYMEVQDMISFNQGMNYYDWQNLMPKSLYEAYKSGANPGTNWLETIRVKNAPMQNHTLNFVGGNDISRFSLGASYTSQDGIFGNPVQSQMERTTVRLNSEHAIYKTQNMDVVTLGENLYYTYQINNGIGTGNKYWNDISNAMRVYPMMPLFNQDGGYFDWNDLQSSGLSNFSAITSNPVADMVYNRGMNISKNHNLNMNAYLKIQPIKGLILKSQFGYKMSSNSYRQYKPIYDLSSTNKSLTDRVQQSGGQGWSYTIENTINYKFLINQAHDFDVLLGQSFEKWGMGEEMSATKYTGLFDDWQHAWLTNGTALPPNHSDISGKPWGNGALASFFGRINYNYKEKYMASVIMRADASSNFARGKRWGYFPSVSAGWVVTNEAFMESTRSWLDFLKIRASWGQNGNANIPGFQYLATVSFDAKAAYSFGNNKTTQSVGGYPNVLPNKDISWERSEQLNLGLDARFLNSRLGLNFDYYIKTTRDWLVLAPQLASYGTGAPYINGGDVENRGVEVALNWNDKVGRDFTYSAGVNFATNQNKVTRIANTEGIIHGPANVLSQGTGEMYRVEVGYPIGYFWGYKTAGIFQNQAEIDAWRKEGYGILQPNIQPGDVKFVDRDKDGVINEKDKTQIGNPNPQFTLGLNLTFGYKGFDLALTGYGSFGQDIARSYRMFGDSRQDNYTTEVFDYWHGEGTSNHWPRLTTGNNPNFLEISDLYIEKGNFFRIQNITLGYDFKKLFPKLIFPQARIYVTAQNLFTITNYKGFDPEVGYSGNDDFGWQKGVDLGFYPSPRTYMVGVNLKF